jgi:hypothetical protein
VDKLQGVDGDLTSGIWNIQLLNSDTLIINCYSDSGELISHFGYSTKKNNGTQQQATRKSGFGASLTGK